MIRTSILPETVPARLFERLERAPEQRALAFYQSRRDDHLAHLLRGPCRRRRIGGTDGRAWCRPRATPLSSCSAAQSPLPRSVLGSLLLGARPLLVAPPSLLGANSDLPRVLSATVSAHRGAGWWWRPDRWLATVTSWNGSRRSTRWLFSEEEALGATRRGRGRPVTSPIPPMWWRTSSRRGPPVFPRSVSGSTVRSPPPSTGWWRPWSSPTGTSSSTGPRSITTWVSVNNFLTCMATGIPLVLMSPHDFVKAPAAWLQGRAPHRRHRHLVAQLRLRPGGAAGQGLPIWRVSTSTGSAAGGMPPSESTTRHSSSSTAGSRAMACPGTALRTNFGCAENIGGATFTRPGEPYRVEFVDREALAETQDGSGRRPG